MRHRAGCKFRMPSPRIACLALRKEAAINEDPLVVFAPAHRANGRNPCAGNKDGLFNALARLAGAVAEIGDHTHALLRSFKGSEHVRRSWAAQECVER
jgi:hypothetical protein